MLVIGDRLMAWFAKIKVEEGVSPDISFDGKTFLHRPDGVNAIPIGSGETVISNPPEGMKPIRNIFVDDNKNFYYEFEDGEGIGGAVVSNPPQGFHKVVNLFVDPLNHRLNYDFDNQQ